MGSFVREQTILNERRAKEMEQQMQTINAAAELQNANPVTAETSQIATEATQSILAK